MGEEELDGSEDDCQQTIEVLVPKVEKGRGRRREQREKVKM